MTFVALMRCQFRLNCLGRMHLIYAQPFRILPIRQCGGKPDLVAASGNCELQISVTRRLRELRVRAGEGVAWLKCGQPPLGLKLQNRPLLLRPMMAHQREHRRLQTLRHMRCYKELRPKPVYVVRVVQEPDFKWKCRRQLLANGDRI